MNDMHAQTTEDVLAHTKHVAAQLLAARDAVGEVIFGQHEAIENTLYVIEIHGVSPDGVCDTAIRLEEVLNNRGGVPRLGPLHTNMEV